MPTYRLQSPLLYKTLIQGYTHETLALVLNEDPDLAIKKWHLQRLQDRVTLTERQARAIWALAQREKLVGWEQAFEQCLVEVDARSKRALDEHAANLALYAQRWRDVHLDVIAEDGVFLRSVWGDGTKGGKLNLPATVTRLRVSLLDPELLDRLARSGLIGLEPPTSEDEEFRRAIRARGELIERTTFSDVCGARISGEDPRRGGVRRWHLIRVRYELWPEPLGLRLVNAAHWSWSGDDTKHLPKSQSFDRDLAGATVTIPRIENREPTRP